MNAQARVLASAMRAGAARRGWRPGKAAGLLLAAFCVWAAVGRAQDGPVSVAPPSPWIVPLRFLAQTNGEDADAGRDSRLLLEDCQINAQTNELFNHVARQLWSSEGVQSHSQLSIDFDPNHQSLVLHWVQLWRGTNALSRLDLANVQVIQREKDLDQYLFNGEQSAVLLLEDVREGDILDYAYTIRGLNPIGSGKFSHLVTVREHEPADRLATQLLWPKSRPLHVKNKGTEAVPAVVKKGDLTEYTWDFTHVEGLEDEDPLPVWFFPLPWVQLSEAQSWSEVAKSERAVFTNSAPLSPELTRQINSWRGLPDAGERVVAVLRFLQDEVRYQGIEMGAGAYKPANPSAVFARRFGDCKDKTLLCVTILRALGIEAWPVLVATDLRQTLQDWLPTASQFDHAIVQVTLDGQSYWLDPTATFQRGPLAARSWPNYGCGLVLRPGTTELAVIPESTVRPKTTVTEYFLIRLLGYPTDLKVVTVADGPDADDLRRQFSADGRTAWQTRALNSFAALYPDIELAAPMDYADDEDQNEVMTTEYYHIRRMWSPSPSGLGYLCRFYPQNIIPAVRKPKVSFRSMPLGLPYPKHEVFRAEITPVQIVPVDIGNRTIENPAIYFHKVVAAPPGKVLLEEEFNTRTDAVPVEGMPGYLRQLEQVFDLTGFTLFSY